MHVYEARRRYNIETNGEFIEILKKLGIDVKDAKSSLSPDELEIIDKHFNKDKEQKSSKKTSSKSEEEEKAQQLVIVNKATHPEEKEEKEEESTLKNKKKRKPKIKAKAKHVVGSSVVKKKESKAKKVKVKAHISKDEDKTEKDKATHPEEKAQVKQKTEVEKPKDKDVKKETDIKKSEQKNIEKQNQKEIKEDKKPEQKKKEIKKISKDGRNKNIEKDSKRKDNSHKKIKLNKHGQQKKIITEKHDKKEDYKKSKKYKEKRYKDESSDKKSKSIEQIRYKEEINKKQKRHPRDKATKKHEKTMPKEKEFKLKKKKPKEVKFNIPESIEITETISVSDLAKKMNIKSSVLISKFMSMGELVTVNQIIDSDTAQLIADEFNCKAKVISLYDETLIEEEKDDEEDLKPRSPIVTVMGHVDHGKTKLLDASRSTNKIASEFGGITQHIGAYKVKVNDDQEIVFLDTPGHEAFTSMRMRGTEVTDIVVLVVAADDGVMPQTLEAVNHAKSAEVPIIVAINKIDSPGSNPDRVKTQLSELNLVPDTWGGDTFMVEISALKHLNIDQLLDTILFVAEDKDLKANPNKMASGTVIESKIDPGRGPVATVIIQTGTLKIGSHFVAGVYKGKVRAMFDDKGKAIKEAPPSTPVEVLGIDGVPEAGDPFQAVEEERMARQVSSKRQEYKRHEAAKNVSHVTLDTLFGAIEDGQVKELNLIVKGDVQGSVEALKEYFEKLSDLNKEIRVVVVHAATGGINESDVLLASASSAIIIGFNVRANMKAAELASKEEIEIRRYTVIYDAVEDVKAAMEGMLSPVQKEEVIGQLEIRDTFKISKLGTIAGCHVTNGYITKKSKVRIIRNDVVIYTGEISSLKRFKDDVMEVKEGFECGLSIAKFNDIKVGDHIEAFVIKEVARKL